MGAVEHRAGSRPRPFVGESRKSPANESPGRQGLCACHSADMRKHARYVERRAKVYLRHILSIGESQKKTKQLRKAYSHHKQGVLPCSDARRMVTGTQQREFTYGPVVKTGGTGTHCWSIVLFTLTTA